MAKVMRGELCRVCGWGVVLGWWRALVAEGSRVLNLCQLEGKWG